MARISKRTLAERHIQARGWGREHWIENLPEYCGKILVIDPGKRGSFHFHQNKMETMLVIKGAMRLRLLDTDTAEEYFQVLIENESILLKPGQPHQIINDYSDEELVVIEFSTIHEETDSKRIQKGD
jgi:mannose-6-phosphate isomerase-like protein (cupin superfamily)